MDSLPDDRKVAVAAIRTAIAGHIPKGFEERVRLGGIMWVVPHSRFPAGYHCDPSKPLMLMSLTSTKGHVALHHMSLYGSGPLMNWFIDEWPKYSTKKLDMGKACIRFKNPEEASLKLIGELVADIATQGKPAMCFADADAIVAHLAPELRDGDVVAIISNGGFDGIHEKILNILKT